MKRIHYNVPADAPLEERLLVKREEIENGRQVLLKNGGARFYDQSKRFVEQCERELADLERQAQEQGLNIPPWEPAL